MTTFTLIKSAAAVLALGTTLCLASLGAAEAKGSHGGGSHGGKSMGMHHSSHHGHHHGHYRRGYYGSGIAYVSGGGCGWLKVRALETGSRYWWARYEDCREG